MMNLMAADLGVSGLGQAYGGHKRGWAEKAPSTRFGRWQYSNAILQFRRLEITLRSTLYGMIRKEAQGKARSPIERGDLWNLTVGLTAGLAVIEGIRQSTGAPGSALPRSLTQIRDAALTAITKRLGWTIHRTHQILDYAVRKKFEGNSPAMIIQLVGRNAPVVADRIVGTAAIRAARNALEIERKVGQKMRKGVKKMGAAFKSFFGGKRRAPGRRRRRRARTETTPAISAPSSAEPSYTAPTYPVGMVPRPAPQREYRPAVTVVTRSRVPYSRWARPRGIAFPTTFARRTPTWWGRRRARAAQSIQRSWAPAWSQR